MRTTVSGDLRPTLTHLRADGVSVLLEHGDDLLPIVRHWGAELGELSGEDLQAVALAAQLAHGDSPFDVADEVTVLPEHARAWIGRPGVEGSRQGRDWSPAFRTTAAPERQDGPDHQRVLTRAVDGAAYLSVVHELELHAGGLLRQRLTLTNDGQEGYAVGRIRLTLPVPERAGELLDFTGRHTMERIPQRQPFSAGVHSREVRTGRTGLDAVHLLCAGEPGFGFRHGQVWAVHLGWSGNQVSYAERLYNGARLLGAGELLEHGEVELGTGESLTTPWMYAAHGTGLDEVASRFHAFQRTQPHHPSRPRPVTLNNWEATYFDHSMPRLKELVDRASRVGAERFVLDDGWFGGRRDDTSSLGDWVVSAEVWPKGLGPLVDHVHARGMEFGLWVEPEMVSLDSDLARAHPEWLFSTGGRVGLASRQQHVLDLGHPGAYAHVRGQLLMLLRDYDIAYLKWDHNRYLNDAGHTPAGTPGVREHTLAAYRLMDELRSAAPGLEIESCAGGGGRVDLGVLERTDRVWASDCIDPLERQQIQRGTFLLVPPELVGTHIASGRSHTTGRRHDLDFRAATALWGHMGIEWDLTSCSEQELEQVATWVRLHREHRRLLHSGAVVNGDHHDDATWVHGVVAQDASEALFHVVSVGRPSTTGPHRVRLPALDPTQRYRVELLRPGQEPLVAGRGVVPWAVDGVVLPGRVLAEVGLPVQPMLPEHSQLWRVRRAGG
ncbi:alpha-galactosidase [Ornithinimicrobium pratense]|uniref:Alpha-galactosidase n=1 Tax=Ornithinimicrobium pratense TaxID=2593973 RepID=A0A5J6V5S0_9MICO|nr:alpha-galactosidase [Ornithinimicrobium pratense]QFG68536.1 alpha-galactosidase [Ornithinimicrobium pratense]